MLGYGDFFFGFKKKWRKVFLNKIKFQILDNSID